MGRLQDQVGHDEQQRKLLREVDPIVKAAIKAGYDAEEMYHWRRDMLVYFIEGGRYKQLKNVWAKIESRLEMMMDWIDVPRDGERIMDERNAIVDQFSPRSITHELHELSMDKQVSARFIAQARRGLRARGGDFGRF